MRISFEGRTNIDPNVNDCCVNEAVFCLQDGTVVIIDRDKTSWLIEDDGSFSMEWEGCYLWGIGDMRPFREPAYFEEEEGAELISNAQFISFISDDEAPADCKVNVYTHHAYF